jgi:hypothetical protein
MQNAWGSWEILMVAGKGREYPRADEGLTAALSSSFVDDLSLMY